MSTKKNEIQKKVLDSLKENLQPITSEESDTLSGGFSSTSAEQSVLPDIEGNVPCNNKSCTTNSVPGCGASQSN